jgi:hypothetical protein
MPSALGAVLSKALRKFARDCDRLKLIRNSWPSIVGADMASSSRVKSFDRATLSIEVAHRSVLQELKFNEQKILNKFAGDHRLKCVKKLKFIFVQGDACGDFPS